jgi:4-amino-4-deoxy-L-arabinose transferase-like glycosyltransferase
LGSHAPLAALAAVVATTLVSPFGRDLFVGDETKYAQVIREMRATGSWFLPTLDGHPFTHKPPLHFWLIDVFTLPLGVYSIWAFVLPSILALVFLLWLVASMSGQGGAPRASRLAAFVTATSIMIWASSQTARMDVSFTAFLTLAAWMLFVFFERDERRALLIAGIALGIATLIKGPMAPVIGIVLFCFEWWRRRRAPRGNYAPALAAMIVIPLLWAVPAMILGGRAYTHEIIVKQTIGRAVSTWVHQAPPWYYLFHLPGVLFPWFILGVIAVVTLRHGTPLQRFCINWILAVLVPYSLMSSKLDVYMMALIPPVAILVADLCAMGARGVRAANAVMLVIYVAVGAIGFFASSAILHLSRIGPEWVKKALAHLTAVPEGALLGRSDVRAFFAVFAIFAIVELLLIRRRSPVASTMAVGLVPVVAFSFAALALMPIANGLASTRPLIVALDSQFVAPEEIALYWCPYLWSRDWPSPMENVRYVDAETLRTIHPRVIITSRIHSGEIAPSLAGLRKVGSLRMIGKWFDVYRR